MGRVVYDKKFAKKSPDLELYYVYRDIKKENGLRYDITVIPAQMLGQEFVRTKGNHNSGGFDELYTVLEGKAIFLMQKHQGPVVEDVVAVKVQKSEFVIVPAEHTVIIINPTNKKLKTANWVSEKNKNIYEELEKMGGMCYFAVDKEKGNRKQKAENIKWVKNKNYKNIPELRFKKPLKQKPENLNLLKGT